MALILGLTAAACNHKDLCYMHTHTTKIKVVYDWRDAPQASPRGMCVFFYSTEHPEQFYRFDFDNTAGGEIEIPVGKYRLITYNNDTEAVRFSATNIYEGHKAYTRDGDLLEPLYGNGITTTATTDNGERVVITPDGLWGCHATDVEITEHGLTYTITHYFDDTRADEATTQTTHSGDQIITLYPHDMLCHYSYEVRHVDHADHISKISASLSGMAGSMNMCDERLETEPVTLPVSGKADAANQKVTGSFLTFGHYGSATYNHRMTFYVVMDDGSKYKISDGSDLDVTSQVDNAPDRRNVHIIIDHIKVPDTASSDDGWIPTVDDWDVHNEDLNI